MKSFSFLLAVLGCVLFSIATFSYERFVDPSSDIFFYEKMGADIAAVRGGAAPGEPSSWYPPFAGSLFFLLRLLPYLSFPSAWFFALTLAVAAATLYIWRRCSWKEAALLPGGILLSALLLGPDIVFARYDILLGILFVLVWQAARAGAVAESAFFLLCAGALKGIPLLLFPFFFLTQPKRAWKKIFHGIGVGLLWTCGLPLLLLGPKNTLLEAQSFLLFQGGRGFQVESTWSGIDLLFKNAFHARALLLYHHFATHNADLPATAATGVSGFLLLLLGFLFWRFWYRIPVQQLPLLFCGIVSCILFFSPVFSPQFLVWMMPLLLASSIRTFHSSVPSERLAALFFFGIGCCIMVLSAYLYPWHYKEFVQQTYLWNTVVLNLRNALVLALFFFCLARCGFQWPWRQLHAVLQRSLLRPTLPLPKTAKNIVAGMFLVAAACFIVFICAFKMFDRDVWWHIKAGELVWSTHHLPLTDPFAYTRVGQPYIATHEWLAQLVLAGMYHLGGPTGIILFRTVSMMSVFGALLLLHRKYAWLSSVLIIYAANAVQGSFIERPQLFTYLFFALFLLLAYRVLRKGLSHFVVLVWTIIEILWVNMHGAASIMGVFIVACVVADRFSTKEQRALFKKEKRLWLVVVVALGVSLFLTPTTYHTVTYLRDLLSDKTIAFLQEWQPRPLSAYLGDMAVLWAVALSALWYARRYMVFHVLLLLGTGILSRHALRHEALFVFSAVATTMISLRESRLLERLARLFHQKQLLAMLIISILCSFLAVYTYAHKRSFTTPDQLNGYGVFTPAKGAYDFIEKTGLQGNFFNTYGIGGYLLFRGYPHHLVYVDGRNVDYGFDFMMAMYNASADPAAWQLLEDRYGFTYAILDYEAIREQGRSAYAIHLSQNPHWHLVYLDDWTAIYAKDTKEHTQILRDHTYTLLTPMNMERGNVLQVTPQTKRSDLVRELQRVADENPEGKMARLLLARLALAEGNDDEAYQQLASVRMHFPDEPEVDVLLASSAIRQEQWSVAASFYRHMIPRLGGLYPDVDYRAIENVFQKAGQWPIAAFVHLLARPPLLPIPSMTPVPSSVPSPLASTPLIDLQGDLQLLNDAGVDFAQRGDLARAKEQFLHALILDPGNTEVLNNLGALFLQQQDPDTALVYLRKALERVPGDGKTHYNIAIAFYKKGNLQEAYTEAQKAEDGGYEGRNFRVLLEQRIKGK